MEEEWVEEEWIDEEWVKEKCFNNGDTIIIIKWRKRDLKRVEIRSWNVYKSVDERMMEMSLLIR